MTGNNSPISILSQKNPWKKNDNKVWLASTVVLLRNLEKFNFPPKLPTEKQKAIVALVTSEITKQKGLKEPQMFSAKQTDPIAKEYLTEHFLLTEDIHQAHGGEAFVLDSSGEFITTLNMGDHIHFGLMDSKGELESGWNRLIKIESAMGKAFKYAFSQRFGFLTADPSLSGTALQISLYLQLPALVHSEKIDDALEAHANENYLVMGLQGSPTEIIGDVLVIKNNYTLGVTEENILTSLRNIATKLMLEENAARSEIRQKDSAEIKDRVSRAYGILIHSYQIEAIEALNALSLIKLGVDLDWVSGIGTAKINELFFNCRRAHLLTLFKEEIPQEELGHKRAEYIHKALEKVKLKI